MGIPCATRFFLPAMPLRNKSTITAKVVVSLQYLLLAMQSMKCHCVVDKTRQVIVYDYQLALKLSYNFLVAVTSATASESTVVKPDCHLGCHQYRSVHYHSQPLPRATLIPPVSLPLRKIRPFFTATSIQHGHHPVMLRQSGDYFFGKDAMAKSQQQASYPSTKLIACGPRWYVTTITCWQLAV